MIEIVFDSWDRTMDLTVTGHAAFAEKGKDIVCSAVSILFYTLAAALDGVGEKGLKDWEVFLDAGNGYIRSEAREGYEANVQLIFWTVLNGLEIIAQQYPENVKLSVRQDEQEA